MMDDIYEKACSLGMLEEQEMYSLYDKGDISDECYASCVTYFYLRSTGHSIEDAYLSAFTKHSF